MDAATISALSATLVPAIIATAWIVHNIQNRRELRTEIRKRDALYAEFVAGCSRLTIHAIGLELEGSQQMLDICSMLERIRMSASTPVVTTAERIVKQITG